MEKRNRRKTKLVQLRNETALEALLQEAYSDTCRQISDATLAIDALKTSHAPQDVDDAAKIAKEVGNLLKIRDLSIKNKMDISKILGGFITIESDGGVVSVSDEVNEVIDNKTANGGSLSHNDMERIRLMIEKGNE